MKRCLVIFLQQHDSTKFWPMREVDLIITSPPYGLDIKYTEGDIRIKEYNYFTAEWLNCAWHASRPGGRMCINVPLDTTKGGVRPVYYEVLNAALEAGWLYRTTIVWNEGNISKSVARGSVDSPSAPNVITPVEMIIVMYRDFWKRPSRVIFDDTYEIRHEQWLKWTNGLWTFSGENRAWEKHPAAFPLILPQRLIKLFSYTDDLVCDPFLGSGTTAIAAQKLHREFAGFDISLEYIESTRRRLRANLLA